MAGTDQQVNFDIFVIGGGINGCGIARDAAGRGYAVGLCEMDDLASGTSSGSTKLIHGGLRYLEQYQFRLVRESLLERELLWRMAPHIIWPLRFVLPHHAGLRPAWLLRLGLFLYDHLGGRLLLPGTATLDLSHHEVGAPLKPRFTKGFEYSDCWVEDARLVVLNAMDAADRGADIRTRTRCLAARRERGIWRLMLGEAGCQTREVSARLLVNAAGPWVDEVLRTALGRTDAHHVRLVQGSHIVVRRLFDHDRCYIFQNRDGRIVFAITYEQDFTLIGTTDRDYRGKPGAVAISAAETDYLCAAASTYFRRPVTRDDIVWNYSGLRPLVNDGSAKAQEATRDYVLSLEGGTAGQAPLITIFGGKITTYRRLAEAVLARVETVLGRRRSRWTATAPLPGGDFAVDGFAPLCAEIRGRHPFLAPAYVRRLVRAYGTRAWALLDGVGDVADLGIHFGATLYEREVRYLMAAEWARTAEDVVWRRSKLGLRLDQEAVAALDVWMADHDHARRRAAAHPAGGPPRGRTAPAKQANGKRHAGVGQRHQKGWSGDSHRRCLDDPGGGVAQHPAWPYPVR